MKYVALILAMLYGPLALAAFPTELSNPTTASALSEARSILKDIDHKSGNLREAMAARDIPATRIIQLAVYFSEQNIRLDVLKTTPGIGQYARDQLDSQGLDLTAEFNTARAAIEAFVDQVRTTTPQDANNYGLVHVVGGAAGTITFVSREYTPAQTVTLRTLLQTIEDAID